MLTFRRSTGIIVVAFAVLASASVPAGAAKKMTYEQAWANCKADVERSVPADAASQKHSRAAGCMKQHGYRLKKSSSM